MARAVPEALLVMSYTGIRWAEAIGLRVKDLDMLRRRITPGAPVRTLRRPLKRRR